MVIIDGDNVGNSDKLPKSGGARASSEAAEGAMTDTSVEVRWLAKRFSGVEGLISNREHGSHTICYYHSSQGGWRTLSVEKAEAKKEFS